MEQEAGEVEGVTEEEQTQSDTKEEGAAAMEVDTDGEGEEEQNGTDEEEKGVDDMELAKKTRQRRSVRTKTVSASVDKNDVVQKPDTGKLSFANSHPSCQPNPYTACFFR